MSESNDDRFTDPVDSNGNSFDPHTGSLEPQDGRCRAVLKNTYERYGKRRFCTAMPENTFVDGGSNRCKMHNDRDELLMKANEVFDTGYATKDLVHQYDKLHPAKKYKLFALYHSLMNESVFDFDPDFQKFTVDFSDVDEERTPLMADDNDVVKMDVPFATAHHDRGEAIFRLAARTITLNKMGAKLMANDFEKEKVVDAELDYDTGEWTELLGKEEHHLNLEHDRLQRSRDDLLEYCGIGVEDEREANDADADTVVEIYNSPDAEDPLPETLNDEDVMDDLPVQ